MENLLRLAREECGAALAFAALDTSRDAPRVYSVPGAYEHTLVTRAALVELARQASHDPELPHARILVRSVDVGVPLTLVIAAAPAVSTSPQATMRQEEPGTLMGLLFEAGHELDELRCELVAQLAERLGRHARARREVALLREPRPADVDADAPSGEDRDGCEVAEGPVDDVLGDGEHSLVRGIFETDLEDGAERRSAPCPAGRAGITVCAPGPARAARFLSEVQRLLAMEAQPVLAMEAQPVPAMEAQPVPAMEAQPVPAMEIQPARALALVLVEVPGERTALVAARALSAQLRSTDPLTRLDRDLFAVALLLVHGGARADAVEARLGRAVEVSIGLQSPVRTTHVVAGPGDRHEVGELLRRAIAQLPGRAGAAEPPGGGRGAPLLGSPSPMVTS